MIEFSELEREIIKRVALGQSNSEIAAALGKTTGSIRVRLTTIYAAANARSRVELATMAIREGLA